MSKNKIFEEIKIQISSNEIVLFMKGTKNFPQCGFSAMVIDILQNMKSEFKDINVLADDALRQGIKKYSNWPTIPQLYINSQFIGGCDIVRELYKNGELSNIIKYSRN